MEGITKKGTFMSENFNQPQQDPNELSETFPSISSSLLNQDSLSSTVSPYEEPPVPYLPLPSEIEQPASPSPEPDDSQGEESTSFSLPPDTGALSPGKAGMGILVGIVLGAILGGLCGHIINASVPMWVGIGTVVGGVIGLLPSLLGEGDGSWLLLEGLSVGLDGGFDCCLTSMLFVVAFILVVGGLVFGHGLLLAALLEGGSTALRLFWVS